MCQNKKLALELCLKYGLYDLHDVISNVDNFEDEVFFYICDHQSEKIVQAIIETNKDEWKYYYCRDVQDRQESWSTITDDGWKYYYCLKVCDRQEIWSKITSDYWKYEYCRDVQDRQELWSTITENEYKYYYCRNIQDHPELSSTITDEFWKNQYMKWKKEKK